MDYCKNEKKAIIAVVIPCYNVKSFVLSIVENIGPEVSYIYIVDDHCPEKTGQFIENECADPRVKVIYHTVNQGVGAATMSGYSEAISSGADVIVKIDGDGQMDPGLINHFTAPIINGRADYTKGNRFYNLDNIGRMPRVRIIGNAVLSFISKLSTGYWNIFDPTNGYTAIQAKVAKKLPFEKISKRFFFETDVLFRLNLLKANVVDIPIDAVYNNEKSNLKIRNILFEFAFKNLNRFFKRIFYNYYLRDFSVASLELIFGLLLLLFGIVFGAYNWIVSISEGIPSTAGTVMVSAITVIIGIQFLIAFLNYDISSVPKRIIHDMLD